MKFLGHLVSAEGVGPNPSNVEKIVNWPIPKNVTGVHALLGMGIIIEDLSGTTQRK